KVRRRQTGCGQSQVGGASPPPHRENDGPDERLRGRCEIFSPPARGGTAPLGFALRRHDAGAALTLTGDASVTHDDPHSRSADPVHEGRPVEAQYGRQGRKGARIVWLLAISTALAAAALLGWWALNSGGLAETNPDAGREPAVAAAFAVPNSHTSTAPRPLVSQHTAPPYY